MERTPGEEEPPAEQARKLLGQVIASLVEDGTIGQDQPDQGEGEATKQPPTQ